MQQDDFELNPPPNVVPMSKAELDFLEEHNQAVIDWQREFSDAKPEKQREMLGWEKVPTEKTNPEWIAQTPLVRVLLEMPEQDALWLRNRMAQQRMEHKNNSLPIATGEYYKGEAVHKSVEIHIREILIYG